MLRYGSLCQAHNLVYLCLRSVWITYLGAYQAELAKKIDATSSTTRINIACRVGRHCYLHRSNPHRQWGAVSLYHWAARAARSGIASTSRPAVARLGGSIESWRPVTAALLERGFQVLVVDFPGFGRSSPPPSAWGVPDYTETLIALIESLAFAPSNIIAHSFGGARCADPCRYPP